MSNEQVARKKKTYKSYLLLAFKIYTTKVVHVLKDCIIHEVACRKLYKGWSFKAFCRFLSSKTFDFLHPNFSLEIHIVKLGLSTDGFNPFRISHST